MKGLEEIDSMRPETSMRLRFSQEDERWEAFFLESRFGDEQVVAGGLGSLPTQAIERAVDGLAPWYRRVDAGHARPLRGEDRGGEWQK